MVENATALHFPDFFQLMGAPETFVPQYCSNIVFHVIVAENRANR